MSFGGAAHTADNAVTRGRRVAFLFIYSANCHRHFGRSEKQVGNAPAEFARRSIIVGRRILNVSERAGGQSETGEPNEQLLFHKLLHKLNDFFAIKSIFHFDLLPRRWIDNRSTARRTLKVKQNRATRVEKTMGDDCRPKIASAEKNKNGQQGAERAGNQHAQRILVSVRRSEENTLNHTSCDPCAAISAEEHGEPLHQKSSEHEFFIKSGADQDIEHRVGGESEISLQRAEAAEIAMEPGLLRKINSRENNNRDRDAAAERARPTLWPF